MVKIYAKICIFYKLMKLFIKFSEYYGLKWASDVQGLITIMAQQNHQCKQYSIQIYISKLDQLRSGAIYCQVLDIIFPNNVQMARVNWKAKYDYQFIANMKLVQTALDKTGTKKKVDIQKISKAKVQQNIEFIQWLKKEFDMHCSEQRLKQYNPQQRRHGHQIDLTFADKKIVPKKFTSTSPKHETNKQKSPSHQIKSPIRPISPNKIKSPPKVKKAQIKEADKKDQTQQQKKSNLNSKNNSHNSQMIDKQMTSHDQSGWKEDHNIKQLQQELKYYKDEANNYKQIAKYTQMKLQTVKGILKGQDSDQMKIGLIFDILQDIAQK